jgi:hypothetical protein
MSTELGVWMALLHESNSGQIGGLVALDISHRT